jgi:phosphohistidine phosphatase
MAASCITVRIADITKYGRLGSGDCSNMPASYELYLIRHSIAEERGEAWPDDSRRPLTARGKAGMRKVARGLLRLDIGLDVILTSPFARARQTAEIVAHECDARPPIVAVDSLTPSGSFQDLLADLERQARHTRIALVGHEPDMGELAARLAGLRRPLPFKKGAVCRIDATAIPPEGLGVLRWFATPKMLRAVCRR